MPFVFLAECFNQSSLLETNQGMSNDYYQKPRSEKQETGKPDDYQWRCCHQKGSVERVPYIGKRALSNQSVLAI